jgi:hypothetical protein
LNEIIEVFFGTPRPARLARLRFGLRTFKASSTRDAAALHAAEEGIGKEIPFALVVISTSTSSSARRALSADDIDDLFHNNGKFFAIGIPDVV